MKGFNASERDGKERSESTPEGKNFLATVKADHDALFADFLARAEADEFEDVAEFTEALRNADWEHKDYTNRQSYRNGIRLGRSGSRKRRD